MAGKRGWELTARRKESGIDLPFAGFTLTVCGLWAQGEGWGEPSGLAVDCRNCLKTTARAAKAVSA
jgi:hypothetical protein